MSDSAVVTTTPSPPPARRSAGWIWPSRAYEDCATEPPVILKIKWHAERTPALCRWTIERIGIDAAAIGPSTTRLTALILESRPHREA
jgi:hypothetical protein